MRRILPLCLLLALLPTSASALTVQDIVALSSAGVSENVLVAMIDRDRTIFAIDASQVIALKRDGVSEKVVIAMLKSGREEPVAGQTAASGVASFVANEPTLVAVGHGPERPNTYHSVDSLGGFVYPPFAPLVYSSPYLVGVSVAPSAPGCSAGRRVASGRRIPTGQVDCRRSR
jgi:hypothetical protein